jgi:serine/threonine protein kinase/tetratricopeptide (TPR) repeat protein
MDAVAEKTVRRADIPMFSGDAGAAGNVPASPPTTATSVEDVARSYHDFLKGFRPGSGTIDDWAQSVSANKAAEAGVFRELHRSDPTAAERFADAVTGMPEVGDRLLGFVLNELLGRGAFAHVFLARQADLAHRPVVLKVSADFQGESQTLAQLQHTNIVPIYSAHRAGPHQVLCMPYFGRTTLADVYRALEGMPSLPVSGRGLVSTLKPQKWSTVKGSASQDGKSAAELTLTASNSCPDFGLHNDGPAPTLQMLGGLSYVEAVLWLGTRLADGLAHAHERGIIHRDLKPANILLTDDGRPMLLDFNLSEDPLVGGAKAGMGGTLPYMAPEQLEAFAGQMRPVDARSDLFSLGIILYELLTRRRPYPARGRGGLELIGTMIQDRVGPPPRLRPYNRAVTPAVEAIVRRCLEADLQKRYQSATELKEDLERHLAHRPLMFTPEPSLRERLGKWRRRHPVVTSTGTLAAASLVLIAALACGLVTRGQRLDRLQAEDGLRRTADDARIAQAVLFDRNAGTAKHDDGIALCRTALERFGVLGNPTWKESRLVRPLSPNEKVRLSESVADLLFLLSDSTRQRAAVSAAGRDDDSLREALEMNTLALACYSDASAPQSLWRQRAQLADLAGLPSERKDAESKAAMASARPDKDAYLTAYLSYTSGKYREALPQLRRATLEDPRNFVAWFARGLCHYALLQDSDAVACFNCCVALRPEFAWSWYNRGLAFRRQRQFAPAKDDFDKFVTLLPDNPRGYVNRASAEQGLKQHAAAIDDLTRALDLARRHDAPLTSIYFLRAEVRAKANDKEAARADLLEGLRQQPTDEAGFIDRGLARVESDPKGALADFDEALRINPMSFDGLQNKAAILSERFGGDAESLQVMDRAVRLYPDSVLARAGRGVLLARRGDRDRALTDAQAALLLDPSPSTLYQVACIYALTSKREAGDRVQALHLLSAALQKGYGLDFVADDKDLDQIRDAPQFRQIVDGARALVRNARHD